MMKKQRKSFFGVLAGIFSFAMITVMGTVPLYAETLEELKQQLNALQKKVEAMEANQMKAPRNSPEDPASPYIVKGKSKGSFRLPDIKTDITLGGYAKVDAVYSDKSAGTGSAADQFFVPTAIPLGDHDTGNDEMVIHGRQSRLFFKSETETDFGLLKTHIEGDFFGTGGNQKVSNSYSFRLRHAYGQLGNLLAGQYWSTFMNASAIPETLDFGGPAATLFIRQAQLRWTQPFQWGSFQVSVENPETTLVSSDPGFTNTSPDNDQFPDIVARVNFKTDFGNISLAGIARQFSIDDDAYDDTMWGGAVGIGGRINTYGKDDLRFMLHYGNAIGRYMTTAYAGAILDAETGELETYDQWGGFLAYRHFWLDSLRSTIAYSYGGADNDVKLVSETANKSFQSLHANLIWSPVPRTHLGIEYLWGNREIENGEDGDLNRVQLSCQYNFF